MRSAKCETLNDEMGKGEGEMRDAKCEVRNGEGLGRWRRENAW